MQCSDIALQFRLDKHIIDMMFKTSKIFLLLFMMMCGLSSAWAAQQVIVEPLTGGTIVPDKQSASAGETVTLTVTPASGYQIAKADIIARAIIDPGNAQAPGLKDVGPEVGYAIDLVGNDPAYLSMERTYTFVMPEAPLEMLITATFTKSESHSITIADAENGTVSASAGEAVLGETVTITATPDPGYELDKIVVTADGIEIEVGEDGSFIMPDGAVNVVVTFKAIDYTITVNPSDNGSVIAPATAHVGDQVVLTVTPADGYELDELVVMPANNSVTCADVIAGADDMIYRVSGKVTHISSMEYGNYYLADNTGEIFIYGTLDNEGNTNNFESLGINEGDYVTVEGSKTTYLGVVELVDVRVVNVDIETHVTENGYTFTMPASDVVVSATFKKSQLDLYVIGHINGKEFAANDGVAMTTTDGNAYTASVSVRDVSGGYGFFIFTSKLGANADDWDGIATSRIVAQSDGNDFLVTGPLMNNELSLGYASGYSMKIPAGDYNLTIDLAAMKLIITGGTQLSYILASGVEGVDYTVINDLSVVDRHAESEQFFTSDSNGNWMTLKAGDFYFDASLSDAFQGGRVSGVFAGKALNPYLTLTTAPTQGEAVAVEPETYNLANEFAPKVDEVIIVSKAYYQERDNSLRAYAPGPAGQGQSLTVDTSLFDYNFQSGKKYTVRGVVNIKEPWATPAPAILDYDYLFQNYKLLVLDVVEEPIPTAIDTIEAVEGVKSVTYINPAGQQSVVPFQGINIVVTEMTDGSRTTTKLLK